MNVLFIDDNGFQITLVEKLIHSRFAKVKLFCSKFVHCIFSRLACYEFDILILDFTYPGFDLSDETKIIDELRKFRGKIVIYSSHEESYIRKKLPKDFNFHYISKKNSNDLMKFIEKEKVEKYGEEDATSK